MTINQKMVNFDKYESASSADFNDDDLDIYGDDILFSENKTEQANNI